MLFSRSQLIRLQHYFNTCSTIHQTPTLLLINHTQPANTPTPSWSFLYFSSFRTTETQKALFPQDAFPHSSQIKKKPVLFFAFSLQCVFILSMKRTREVLIWQNRFWRFCSFGYNQIWKIFYLSWYFSCFCSLGYNQIWKASFLSWYLWCFCSLGCN